MNKKEEKAFSQTYGRLLSGQTMLEYLGTTGTPYAERARKLAQEIDAFINEDFLPSRPAETPSRALSPFRQKVVQRRNVTIGDQTLTESSLECGHTVLAQSGRRFYVCQDCASDRR